MSDESVRRHVMTDAVPPRRHLVEVGVAEALDLLGSVEFGRVVFSNHALPAIRPVNHLVHDGKIIIRTHLGGAVGIAIGGSGAVVAYQADWIDPRRRLGWSVVATGYARAVADPLDVARFEAALTPWVDKEMDTVISIQPQIVTGFRLVEAG